LVVIVTPIFPDSVDRTSAFRLVPLDSFDFASARATPLLVGLVETQHDFLVETSPVFHADKITKPLMVLQGANDPRVIKAESDDIVAAVKKNGVPVEYLVFDDEGHGFSKKANQAKANAAIKAFLDQHLMKR